MTSTWAGPPPRHWSAAGQPSLVGRESELGLLADAWTAVRDGVRQLVLIGGESGGGKSRLAAEAAIECARSGAAVLTGNCVAELGSPYQPFAEPVGVLLSGSAGDPALAELLALIAGRPPAGGRDRVHEYRPRLYAAVVDALRSAAADRPVVLVLEDLHWAAPDGLQLLRFVVEHTADTSLLVLATHRTTAPDRTPALVQALAGLYRLPGVRRIDLVPLRAEDVAEFLVLETGQPLDRAHPPARALHRHTGGNPFFLREVWRDLAGRGGLAALRNGTIPAPESVRDTFQVRLDGLPASSRQLLELAAVLGDEVALDLLLALDARTPAPAGPDAVLTALDDAVATGLLEPVASTGADFRFLHALGRQAVLDLMPPSRLTRYHAMAVDVLETRPDVHRCVQRLAHHSAGARALGYGGQAVRYLVEAAGLADRALAHDEAAALYEQAAALPEALERRHELRLLAARSHFLSSDFLRAMDLDREVFEHGSPRDRLAAAIGYEAASWHLGKRGHRASEQLTAALMDVHRDPADPLVVRALSGLGRALAFTGAIGQGAAVASRAIELARALGRDDLLAHALQAGHHIGNDPASSATRLARAEELSTLVERSGDLGHLCAAGYQRATIGYLRGDPELVDQACADMIRAARNTGQPFWEYVVAGYEYARAFLAGDLAGADRAARAQRERGRGLGSADHAEGPFGVQTYMVRREAGLLEQVRPLISGRESPTDVWAPGLLALYTELGLREPARRVLGWLFDEGLERYETSGDWPVTLAFLTEAALALEDEAAARRLRPRLAEYAGLNLAAGPFVAVLGSADRYLGSVDSLLRRGGATEELECAVAMDTRMQAPLYVAHSLAAQVLHLRRTHAPGRQVQEVVEQARRTAEPLALHRVLRILGTASGSGCRPDGLTAREIEILRLLADGLSNRDIADTLVISESTAANHVRSIFVKTGATNRTQAARYAATRDLLA